MPTTPHFRIKGSGTNLPMISTSDEGVRVCPAHATSTGFRAIEFANERSFDAADYEFELIVTKKYQPTYWGRKGSTTGQIMAAYRAVTQADADYYKSLGHVQVKVEVV